MTTRRQKKQETFDVRAAARALGADWAVDGDFESPDFCVRDGAEVFGLEHVTVHCGAKTAKPGRKPAPRLLQESGRRESLIADVRRTLSRAHDIPLRVVMRGNIAEGTTEILASKLLEVDWASEQVGRRVDIQGIPGLKVHAMRALCPEWIDVDYRIGWIVTEGTALFQEAINRKKSKLPAYRTNAGDDVRLLVVANHYHASGKIDVPEVTEVDVDAGGFSRVYFMAIPKYVIEFGNAGRVLRRLTWPRRRLCT